MIRIKLLERLTSNLYPVLAAAWNISDRAHENYATVIINKIAEIEGIPVKWMNPFQMNSERRKGFVAGQTDGKEIRIVHHKDQAMNMFLFLHEYAHVKLHYSNAGMRLPLHVKEIEADSFAINILMIISPGEKNYKALIKFCNENPIISEYHNKHKQITI